MVSQICIYSDLCESCNEEGFLQIQPRLVQALQEFRLQIAPEEVQQQPPWKYVGVKMLDQKIQPQTNKFSTKLQTLNGAQKLLGIIS